MPNNYYQSW